MKEEFFEKNKKYIYLVVGIITFICVFICCIFSFAGIMAYMERPSTTDREIVPDKYSPFK